MTDLKKLTIQKNVSDIKDKGNPVFEQFLGQFNLRLRNGWEPL